MKKKLKRLLAFTLAAVLLTGTFSVTADAAAKRTVKKQIFTAMAHKVDKNAAKVKKGTTTLVYKTSEAYVKFVAPAAKTYTFTFSDYKIKGESRGCIYACKKDKRDPGYLSYLTMSTKGGKADALWMASKGIKEDKKTALVKRHLHKRSTKIKLKKGEAVYFYFYGGLPGKATMKLNIK